MTDYYADLDRIRAAGLEYATNGIAAGETAPLDAPFSGEWAGGLTGQDVLDAAGVDATFGELDDFEQADILDSWEDGYLSAEWPSSDDGRRYTVDVLSYGRWGHEGTPLLTHYEAKSLQVRLEAMPHVERTRLNRHY